MVAIPSLKIDTLESVRVCVYRNIQITKTAPPQKIMGCAQSKTRGPRHPYMYSSKERTKFHSRKESAMPNPQKSSSTITKESNFSPDHIGANSTLKSCGDKNLSSHWTPPKALDCDVTDESINTIAEATIESDAKCLCQELKTVDLVDTAKSKDYYLMNESQIKQVNAKHIVENTTTKCEMKNSIVEDLSSNFIGSTCDLTEDMLIEEGKNQMVFAVYIYLITFEKKKKK